MFIWDDSKAKSNYQKHGMTFEEAASIFLDSEGLHLEDLAHSFLKNALSV